ncbi:hypothetical protein H206_05169 [Candidatus Electrothrix aarhusensis]|uniref:Uncharacterized protein n=1 Tax=Candidatus Electrothrix aarhusensis TaxID=1859131 RepID=A0A444J5C2_9BACT|nr:hypothetical protein H206_05169 [Candidatus Electrothrix aarhusensis]
MYSVLYMGPQALNAPSIIKLISPAYHSERLLFCLLPFPVFIISP